MDSGSVPPGVDDQAHHSKNRSAESSRTHSNQGSPPQSRHFTSASQPGTSHWDSMNLREIATDTATAPSPPLSDSAKEDSTL